MKTYEGEIVHQVFLAIEGEGKMVVGQKVSLEMLSKDDDGIFPNIKSWRGFLYGNFGTGDGSYYLNGEPSKNLIKKYCYPLDDYKHLFVQKVGGGKYIEVDAENLEFSFEYDANYFSRRDNSNLSSMVEIFVRASIKE